MFTADQMNRIIILYIYTTLWLYIYVLSFGVLWQWITSAELNLKTTAFSFNLILVCCSVKISLKQVCYLQIKWLPLDQSHKQLFCKGTLNHLWLPTSLWPLICLAYVQTNWLQAQLSLCSHLICQIYKSFLVLVLLTFFFLS